MAKNARKTHRRTPNPYSEAFRAKIVHPRAALPLVRISIPLQHIGEKPVMTQAARELVDEPVPAFLGLLEQMGKHLFLCLIVGLGRLLLENPDDYAQFSALQHHSLGFRV